MNDYKLNFDGLHELCQEIDGINVDRELINTPDDNQIERLAITGLDNISGTKAMEIACYVQDSGNLLGPFTAEKENGFISLEKDE